MLWLLLPALLLALLHLYGRVLPQPALLAVWLLLAGALAAGGFIRLRLRRRVFLQAYVYSASPLRRWLRGGPLQLCWQAVLALLLSAVLLVALVRLREPAHGLLLALGLLALAPLYALTASGLGRHVAAGYLPEMAWRLTQALLFFLLLALLSALALWQPQPALASVSLDRALWHFIDAEQARSDLLLRLLQLAALFEGLRLWLGQQLIPVLQWQALTLLAWGLVLAQQALVVWAWLRLGTATLLLVDVARRRRGG